jgi:hypothetical protein
MGDREILHLLVDMYPVKMSWGGGLTFHLSIGMGLRKETPMPDVHSLLGVVKPNGLNVI